MSKLILTKIYYHNCKETAIFNALFAMFFNDFVLLRIDIG